MQKNDQNVHYMTPSQLIVWLAIWGVGIIVVALLTAATS